MNYTDLEKKVKTASCNEIIMILEKCSIEFKTQLNINVDIKKYGKKIFDFAITFEFWDKNELVGLVAAYFNNNIVKVGFITSVCVRKEYQNCGLATILLNDVINYAEKNNYLKIKLEVYLENIKAISLYKKLGFKIIEETDKNFTMKKVISYREKESN